MEMLKNSLNWFEIPVVDFDRARKFYSAIYDFDMPTNTMGGYEMGFFLAEQGCVGGAIVKGEGCVPSQQGTTVYLNGGNDLQVVLDRIAEAGGTTIVPKTLITPEIGYFAMFIDCEGNKVALHSMN